MNNPVLSDTMSAKGGCGCLFIILLFVIFCVWWMNTFGEAGYQQEVQYYRNNMTQQDKINVVNDYQKEQRQKAEDRKYGGE